MGDKAKPVGQGCPGPLSQWAATLALEVGRRVSGDRRTKSVASHAATAAEEVGETPSCRTTI